MNSKMNFKPDTLLQLPGYLLVYSFIIAVISGILLAFYYVPSPQNAALSLDVIQERIFAGKVVVTMHRMSGVGVILFTLLNTVIILLSKNKIGIWIRIWQTGIVLIALYIGARITGHLLLGNTSSIYLLKCIITKFAGTASLSTAQSVLIDSLPVAFIRIYILHILILPVITGNVVYYYIACMKQFGAELGPLKMRPTTLLILFTTVMIILSIVIKPVENHVPFYGESWQINAPWEIHFLTWVINVLSFPGAIISILAVFVLLLLLGPIVRKIQS